MFSKRIARDERRDVSQGRDHFCVTGEAAATGAVERPLRSPGRGADLDKRVEEHHNSIDLLQ